jgi:WD40 repeat protein
MKAEGDVKFIVLDQERLFTGGTGRSLQIWSKASLECIKSLTPIADVHCIAIDEKRVYTGGSNNSFQVWDKTSLDCISTVPVDGNVNFIALDGFRLLTGGTNRLLQIWEKASVPTLTNTTKANSDVYWIEVDDSRVYASSFDRNEVELWEKADLYYSS